MVSQGLLLKVSGRKAELIERLLQSMGQASQAVVKRSKLAARAPTTSGSSLQTQAPAKSTRKASIRLLGDSNAVGYRPPPIGTRSVLADTLSLHKDVEVLPTVGRCGLTLLPSPLFFHPYLRDQLANDSLVADYSVLILGTNDITCLKSSRMQWSKGATDKEIKQRVEQELDRVLSKVIFPRTRRKVLVTEPVNDMSSKNHVRGVVVSAMHQKVMSLPNATWISMGWHRKDLQPLPTGVFDPVHFSCGGARRLVRAIRTAVKDDLLPAQPPLLPLSTAARAAEASAVAGSQKVGKQRKRRRSES